MTPRIQQALSEVCPACGERYLAYIDALGDQFEYLACCDQGRAVVGDSGFFGSLSPAERRDLLAAIGAHTREVNSEYRALWPLVVGPIDQRTAF